MATQEWTIIALVGAALPELEQRLARWSTSRIPGDQEHWSREQWPRRERLAAQSMMRHLDNHRGVPPVIHFSRHIDLWSSYGDLFNLIPTRPPTICHGRGDLWAYRMPDHGRLLRRTRKARSLRSPYSHEYVTLANTLEAAATAYRGLWRESLVLIERRSWQASATDEELLAASAKLPNWPKG